jgi:hypothetical protein
MKTKQLLTESDFKQACDNTTDKTIIQNHKHLYFDFGFYGAKLINAKTNEQKIVNFFRTFDYISFCACMDEQIFE